MDKQCYHWKLSDQYVEPGRLDVIGLCNKPGQRGWICDLRMQRAGLLDCADMCEKEQIPSERFVPR